MQFLFFSEAVQARGPIFHLQINIAKHVTLPRTHLIAFDFLHEGKAWAYLLTKQANPTRILWSDERIFELFAVVSFVLKDLCFSTTVQQEIVVMFKQ